MPVIIIAVVLVPLLAVAYRATSRSKAAGEHPTPEYDRTKQRTEQEFAEAEAFQEQWRKEEKKHPRDTIV